MKLQATIITLILIIGLAAGCGFVKDTVDSYDEEKPTTAAKPTTTPIQDAPIKTSRGCDDNLDKGNNPYVKGATTVTYQGESTVYEDQCIEDYLKEYYCDNDEYRSYKKLCAYGCTAGACLQTEKVEEPKQQTSHETDRTEEDEDEETSVVHCTNGYKDEDETDVDCGGSSCPNCGYAKMCKVTEDCIAPFFCNYRQKICSETKS